MQVKEGYTLNILKDEDGIIRVIINSINDILVLEDTFAYIFLSEYKYILNYIEANYSFRLKQIDNDYEALIYKIEDKKGKLKPRYITKTKHKIIEYVLYMLNTNLTERDKLKQNLTLIKRKWYNEKWLCWLNRSS